MEAPKEYGRIAIGLENLVIPEDKLENTPSRKHGVSEELERDLRVVGCEYIQSAGLLLKLPQVAMATAQVLFQRFYYSKSIINYSVQYMAAACIFVAAKVEEAPRRVRDVINVFHHLRQKRMGRSIQPMDYVGNTYFKVKGEIIQCEKYLLKTLGLCVHVQHPHKLIITFLQVLDLEKKVDLVQSVWNYMNDSLRTNVFVRFSPDKIACACIYLATRKYELPLPTSPGWWLMFDVSRRDIEIISLEILQLYTYPNCSLEELEKEVTKIKEDLAKRKPVEMKEIQLNVPTQSSRNASPSKDSPSITISGDDKKSSLSATESKSPIHVNSRLTERNGERSNHSALSPPKKEKKRLRSSSLEPHPKRRRLSHSPNSGASSMENSGHGDAAFRPIISPIKLSGNSEDSGSPLEDEHLPRKYQNKYDNHKHKKHRKARHERHHKREKHRQRERSRSWTRYESRPLHNVHRNDSMKKHHHTSHRRKNDGYLHK